MALAIWLCRNCFLSSRNSFSVLGGGSSVEKLGVVLGPRKVKVEHAQDRIPSRRDLTWPFLNASKSRRQIQTAPPADIAATAEDHVPFPPVLEQSTSS